MPATFDGILNEPTVDFLGKDGFYWWFGEVVEDKDPLQVGRVKVRISGWYTGLDDKFKETMPDEDLPWAIVLQPTDQGGQEGTGKSAGQLKPGAMVMGFFLDGQEAQQPVVMGVIRAYKPGTVNGEIESIYTGDTYDNTTNLGITNPATGQSDTRGTGLSTSTSSKTNTTSPAPGQPLNALNANLNTLVNPELRPAANGVAGSSNTFETHLSYMLKDIGLTISTLVPKDGAWISVVDGTVKNVDALAGKVKNLISGVLSEAVAGLKELFVTTMAKVIKALKLTSFLGIPFVYTTALQAIIKIVLKYLCDIDSSFLGSALSALSGTVDQFIASVLGKAFDMIFELVSTAFDQIISDILCAIDALFSQIQSIISAISSAIQVVKSVSETFKKGTSFFENLEKLSISDFSSITAILSLLIGLLPTQCNRTAPGGDVNTGFIPFLGSTDCNFTGGSPLGNDGSGRCGSGSGGLNKATNIMTAIINEADPYLTAFSNAMNGSYSAQFSTPGREATLVRTADGTTVSAVKSNDSVANNFKTQRDAAKEGKNPSPPKNEKAGETIAGLHVNCPNPTSIDVHKDMSVYNKGIFQHTIDGNYKLKIVGNLDIEVGGRLAMHVSGAPQTVANNGKKGDTSSKQRKNLIVFDSDTEISGRGKFETQSMGSTVAAKSGTDQKIISDNLSLNVPSMNINCSNDLKLTAGNCMYVETPSLIRNINVGGIPGIKRGITTFIMGGSYDMFITPGAMGAADFVPRFNVTNAAGPVSIQVGAVGFSVNVGAGYGTINVAAGALSLNAAAGAVAINAGAAVSIKAAATCDVKAALISLN
jgi:hypothetical protein